MALAFAMSFFRVSTSATPTCSTYSDTGRPGAGTQPLQTARARNDQLTADCLDDLHCDMHAFAGADATQIQKIVVLVGGVLEIPEFEVIWDHGVVPHRVAHLSDRFQTEISM